MEKIILDTDIGSDIDDAVCLAYLLSHPECQLMGITTVSGQPIERAKLASALCKAAGKDIPIYPGVEEPLFTAQKQPVASQAEKLCHWAHDISFPKNQAIAFLQKTIRSHPHEITLLAIGPMTNLALLFKTDPQIPSLLKRLVVMCGVFSNRTAGLPPAEWNAICDPYATCALYGAHAAVHRSIGLDVTTQVVMKKDEVAQKFTGPILEVVQDFAGVWFTHTEMLTFHDPLAAAAIFDESILQFERGHVSVELASERLKGLTYFDADANGRHEVAMQVDASRFFEHYFSIVQ